MPGRHHAATPLHSAANRLCAPTMEQVDRRLALSEGRKAVQRHNLSFSMAQRGWHGGVRASCPGSRGLKGAVVQLGKAMKGLIHMNHDFKLSRLVLTCRRSNSLRPVRC